MQSASGAGARTPFLSINSSDRNPLQAPVQAPLQAPPLRKREREEAVEDLNHDHASVPGRQPKEDVQKSKRSRHSPVTNSTITLQPRHLVLHRVICDSGENHTRHKEIAHYLDVPRLFAGDSKASSLRGRKYISNVEEHLEDNADISVVIYKTYSCDDYHEIVKDQFERLQIPKIDVEVISSLKSYFFSLKGDGQAAQSISEEMTIISDDLKDAINMIEATNPERMAKWHDPRNMKAPYLHFYHCRGLMDQAAVGLRGIHQQHIAVLLEYLNKAFGPEYDEADALFSRGLVTKLHFPKLFGPNEVVLTSQNDQPLAYISESCPEPDRLPLCLNCWSWTFDGLFRKERTPLHVDWPSCAPKILPISALKTYSLRFDTSGLEERLRKRGKKFWRCRKRNFVSYESPNPSFDVRTVRLIVPFVVDVSST
jgi:hypothetical protein